MAWQPSFTYAAACMMSAAQKGNALGLALGNPYLPRGFLQAQPSTSPEPKDDMTASTCTPTEAKVDDDAHVDVDVDGDTEIDAHVDEDDETGSKSGSFPSPPSPVLIVPIDNDTSLETQGVDLSTAHGNLSQTDNMVATKSMKLENTNQQTADHKTTQQQQPSSQHHHHHHHHQQQQQQLQQQQHHSNNVKPVIKFSIDDILGRASKSSNSISVSGSSLISPPSIPQGVPSIFGSMPPPPGAYPRALLGRKRELEEDEEDEEGDEEEIDVDSEDNIYGMKAGLSEDFDKDDAEKYSWLQCTRYKPPKLPRSKKKEGVKKRKLGRNPRVPFTQHQVGVLEQKFRQTHYLSSVDVAELSAALNLTETRVKIWFQNRRARERRDKDSTSLGQNDGEKQTSPPQPPAEVHKTPSGLPVTPPHPLYFNPMWPLASYPFDARTAHALAGQGMLGNGRGPSAFTPVTFRRYV